MREIRIKVGTGLDAEGIQRALAPPNFDGEDAMSLYPVAEALMAVRDSRVEIHGVAIDDVWINPKFPSQVSISFTSSWSLYVGCRDSNSAGDEDVCETATYTADGLLIFLVPEPRRESNPC